jgi:hypothetical protein
MSFISKILGSATGGLIKEAGNVLDKFITTKEEKMAAQLKLEELLQKRDSEIEQTIQAELKAKENIIVAELQQGDNYTKRARPTVVYFGLFVIFFNYCFIPFVQTVAAAQVAAFALPTEFWVAWGGIVATWTVGRSAEKRGSRNKVTDFITGNKSKSIFLGE